MVQERDNSGRIVDDQDESNPSPISSCLLKSITLLLFEIMYASSWTGMTSVSGAYLVHPVPWLPGRS
jgi:hypothetical protein